MINIEKAYKKLHGLSFLLLSNHKTASSADI